VRSQGLRRQTSPPSPGDTAPQYWRPWARRGPRHLAAVFDRGHTGTTFQAASRAWFHRGAGPWGCPAPLPAPGIKPHRGCRRHASAPLMGLAAGPGGALRCQGPLVVGARVCPVAPGPVEVPVAPWGADVRPIRHDPAPGAAVVGQRDLDDHPARATMGPPGRASRASGAPGAPHRHRPAGPARRRRGPAGAPPPCA
jgi:hypothetical protein